MRSMFTCLTLTSVRVCVHASQETYSVYSKDTTNAGQRVSQNNLLTACSTYYNIQRWVPFGREQINSKILAQDSKENVIGVFSAKY